MTPSRSAGRAPFSRDMLSIIKDLSDGKSAKEIAISKGVPQVALYNAVASAKDDVGVRTTTQLVAKAIRKGWIE